MKNLIKSEWYKLLRNKAFHTLLIITALYSVLQVYIVRFIEIITNSGSDGTNVYFQPQGQNGVLMTENISLMIMISLATFAGFFVASEFQNNTIRYPIGLGKSRINIYLSKLFSIFAVTIILILLSIFIMTLGMSLLFGFGDISLGEYFIQIVQNLLPQIFMHLTYMSIFCMFAFLCRGSGLTIILNIVYILGTYILLAFLSSFTSLSKYAKIFPAYYISDWSLLKTYTVFVSNSIIVGLIYIIVPSIIGILFFKKIDVK